MLIKHPYGQDLIFEKPLLTKADPTAYKASPTIAAGDVKVAHDDLPAANPAAKVIAFTSGSVKPRPGDAIVGATSSATATVIRAILTSGTWAGGDAAGRLFVRDDSGTFESENLNNTTQSENNFATIGGALSAAGVFTNISAARNVFAIPGSQLQCKKASVAIIDAADGPEWVDDIVEIETVDHPDAEDPQGCIAAGTLLSTGQSATQIRLGAAPQSAPRTGFFFVLTKAGAVPISGHVKTYTAGGTFDIVPYVNVPTGLDDTWEYKVYLDAPRVPAHVVANEGTLTTLDALATAGAIADLQTLLSRLSATRAGYLDNLNVGGPVASQADITAINQSASRRVLLATVAQYERPESGSTVYTVEARTYDGDGAPVNADSTPTLTATGGVTGSLAANLGAASNPATGVYRWAYTVPAAHAIEPIRFDFSGAIASTTFTMSVYSQVADFVAATFTTADRTKLDELHSSKQTLTSGERSSIADALLARKQTGGANGTAGNRVQDALAGGLFKVAISVDGETLEILNADDEVVVTRTLTRAELAAIRNAT